jgi:hypothetical protein
LQATPIHPVIGRFATVASFRTPVTYGCDAT